VEGDDHCKAYTTIVWGRLLSRERYYAAEAEAVDIAEGNMCGTAMRGFYRSAVVEDPITHKRSMQGLGRSRVWPVVHCSAGPHGEGDEPKPMMNEREKSDPAVVAGKSANEAGHPAEEQMEPRAGAEGNASQQSTLRALDRAGVSQAPGRTRKDARESKKEKFTALLHHVDVRLLQELYLTLKRDAAPGVDGMTGEDYGLDAESRLVDLHPKPHPRAIPRCRTRNQPPSSSTTSRCPRRISGFRSS